MLTEAITFSQEYLQQLMAVFVDPRKRLFAGYLIAALVIALVVTVFVQRLSFRQAFFKIFDKQIWASGSAFADYKIGIINQAVMMLVSPLLLSRVALATAVYFLLREQFPNGTEVFANTPAWVIVAAFTTVQFLLDDGTKYALHRALHQIPFLWAFHKTHHSAETLTPVTVYRTHPVEGVLFSLRSTLVQSVTISGFVFLFGNQVDLYTVFGVNIFLFLFNALGSNLRHSHVWITYGHILEHIFMSPAQHQIHHSVDECHFDRNFGAVLSVWDWVFGSLFLAKGVQKLRFGVDELDQNQPHSLKALYVTPFFEALRWFKDMTLQKNRGLKASLAKSFGILVLLAVIASPVTVFAKELNVYSHRQPFLIKPFLEAFEKETGAKVNVVYASKGLAQRLQAEGRRSPADVVLTVDIARLSVYADKDLFAAVNSDILNKNIPPHLRDKNNKWFGLSKRARVVAVAKDRVKPEEIDRIEDLAGPEWEGRICSRPGSHVYNRALVASVIAADGEEAAEKWAKGIVSNLARRPQGNDRAQVKAIYQGQCDVAIINSYYFGKLKTSDVPEQREWAKGIGLVFTNQKDRGNHVNISGGGVAKHSQNKELAIKFLEFLTLEKSQQLYGEINFEYPVNPVIQPTAEIRSWGSFSEDKLPIERIAELAPKAQRIIDKVGW